MSALLEAMKSGKAEDIHIALAQQERYDRDEVIAMLEAAGVLKATKHAAATTAAPGTATTKHA